MNGHDSGLDMDSTRITQQTSTALTLQGERTREAPRPRALLEGSFRGPLQWALEGAGWYVLRPAGDFVLLCVAVIIGLGGVGAAAHVSQVRAPLLALPPLTMLLLYRRGLYKTHLRALVLDGIAPIVSALSVAILAVVTLGLFVSGRAPSQPDAVRLWLLGLVAVCAGRTVLYVAQRWARSNRLVGKPVLILGAGLVGSQMARRLENHPEYGLVPIGFLDDEPRSIAEVGGRAMPVLGTLEDLDTTVQRTGVKHLIVAFSSVADNRVSRLIHHCQDLGIGVTVVPRMFDMMNNRVRHDTVGGLSLMTFTAVNPDGFQFMLKHAFDRVFALVLLVGLLPLMLVLALAVRLSSPGPALFRQRRVGRDGKLSPTSFRLRTGSPACIVFSRGASS